MHAEIVEEKGSVTVAWHGRLRTYAVHVRRCSLSAFEVLVEGGQGNGSVTRARGPRPRGLGCAGSSSRGSLGRDRGDTSSEGLPVETCGTRRADLPRAGHARLGGWVRVHVVERGSRADQRACVRADGGRGSGVGREMGLVRSTCDWAGGWVVYPVKFSRPGWPSWSVFDIETRDWTKPLCVAFPRQHHARPGSVLIDGVAPPAGSGDLSTGLLLGNITYRIEAGVPRFRVVTFKVTINANVTNGTVISNHATVTSDDTNPFDTNIVTTTVSAPQLGQPTKTARDVNGGTLNVGDRIRYTVRLSNTGAQAAQSIQLLDNLPPYVGGLDLILGPRGGRRPLQPNRRNQRHRARGHPRHHHPGLVQPGRGVRGHAVFRGPVPRLGRAACQHRRPGHQQPGRHERPLPAGGRADRRPRDRPVARRDEGDRQLPAGLANASKTVTGGANGQVGPGSVLTYTIHLENPGSRGLLFDVVDAAGAGRHLRPHRDPGRVHGGGPGPARGRQPDRARHVPLTCARPRHGRGPDPVPRHRGPGADARRHRAERGGRQRPARLRAFHDAHLAPPDRVLGMPVLSTSTKAVTDLDGGDPKPGNAVRHCHRLQHRQPRGHQRDRDGRGRRQPEQRGRAERRHVRRRQPHRDTGAARARRRSPPWPPARARRSPSPPTSRPRSKTAPSSPTRRTSRPPKPGRPSTPTP